jgi:hypothetical protein
MGRWFKRGEIPLLSILDERQDSTLHLAGSRAATPAVSEVLFNLCRLLRGQLAFKGQKNLVFVRMPVSAK